MLPAMLILFPSDSNRKIDQEIEFTLLAGSVRFGDISERAGAEEDLFCRFLRATGIRVFHFLLAA